MSRQVRQTAPRRRRGPRDDRGGRGEDMAGWGVGHGFPPRADRIHLHRARPGVARTKPRRDGEGHGRRTRRWVSKGWPRGMRSASQASEPRGDGRAALRPHRALLGTRPGRPSVRRHRGRGRGVSRLRRGRLGPLLPPGRLPARLRVRGDRQRPCADGGAGPAPGAAGRREGGADGAPRPQGRGRRGGAGLHGVRVLHRRRRAAPAQGDDPGARPPRHPLRPALPDAGPRQGRRTAQGRASDPLGEDGIARPAGEARLGPDRRAVARGPPPRVHCI